MRETIMSKFTLKSLVAASFLLVGASGASAGTDAVRAEAFFNAISGGNADTVASFYAEKAEFHWVGGPLAGIYKGRGQIKGVWERFAQAAGKLDYRTLEVTESRNGPISTVTARVKFIGPKEVPVKFVLMFKDGKIVNQIWQVDRGEGYTAAKAPVPEGKPAQPQAAGPKPETPGKLASANEAAEAAPAQDESQAVETGAGEAPDGAPESAEAGPVPDPEQGEQQAAAQAPGDGASAPGADARGEPGADAPAGIAPPVGGEPKKKVVRKVEKKTYEPDEYEDEDYRHYRRYRGHYGYRWHGGHGYGRRSGYGHY
jgi:hypothetical protein